MELTLGLHFWCDQENASREQGKHKLYQLEGYKYQIHAAIACTILETYDVYWRHFKFTLAVLHYGVFDATWPAFVNFGTVSVHDM